MKLSLYADSIFTRKEYAAFAEQVKPALEIVDSNAYPDPMLDWVDVDRWVNKELLAEINALAAEIRQNADIFVVVGLGGSNQGARAVIEALGHTVAENVRTPRILYAGVNLSPAYLEQIFSSLDGCSVYVNVIAKNFKTLEPGAAFRFIRDYMEKRYSAEELKKRIITTATHGDGELHAISQQRGYRCLQFPPLVGGRYSVFTPVGLLPVAVAGIDTDALAKGARAAMESYRSGGQIARDAKEYALTRNLLLSKNYDIEILSFFEPSLEALGKWWRQLFGESEGKQHTGIFPALCSYSEDLHSMGQFLQQGKRHLIETFLWSAAAPRSLPVPKSSCQDGFEYLEGKTLEEVNRCAFEATLKAHSAGGVPCFVLELPELCPYAVGELLYFFMIACYYSAVILGVNPFDQPGVENYKQEMFTLLKGK